MPAAGFGERTHSTGNLDYLSNNSSGERGPIRNAFNLLQAQVLHILKPVKTFRIVLGFLAIIPITLLVDSVSQPATYGEVTLGELAYLVFGTPISIFNLWVWIEPEIIELYFPSVKNE